MRSWLEFVVLFGIIGHGMAIMCYECNSASNSLCLEKILPDSLKRNCSENSRGITYTLCRKIIQDVDFGIYDQLPSTRVIRSCGWDDSKYKNTCYHRSGFGGRQDVCSCETDFCNSASTTPPNLLYLILLPVLHLSIIIKL